MNRAVRLGWAALALVAVVVLPLRLAEIGQAHADKAPMARWAVTSPESN